MPHIKRKASLGKSQIKKRTVVVRSHKSSVSMEQSFWDAIKEIANANNIGLAELVTTIDNDRKHANLSSAIRLFVLEYYRRRLTTIEGKQTGLPPKTSIGFP
jgi:predicted DNA-binding ribbon-helix-helix protein